MILKYKFKVRKKTEANRNKMLTTAKNLLHCKRNNDTLKGKTTVKDITDHITDYMLWKKILLSMKRATKATSRTQGEAKLQKAEIHKCDKSNLMFDFIIYNFNYNL